MFKSAFEPAMVENLAAALEDACVRYAQITGECDSLTRDEIANRMIGAARHGERDPEALIQAALRDLTGIAA